jgi:uncharacterized protein involved in exopolysaccharide biosynthesis
VNPELVKPTNGSVPSPYYVDAPPQQDAGVSVKLISYAIFKRKWQVLGVIAVVVLSIVIAGAFRPSVWKTSAKFLVRPARAEIQVGAGAQRELTFPVSASTEMLNSEMEILRSQELMRQVLAKFTAEGKPIFGADSDLSEAEQVAALQGMIVVSPAPESNVITVDLFAKDPEKGRVILSAIAETFLERHASLHGNPGATAFFEEQKQVQRQRVIEAENRLADFVEREQLVFPEDQIRAALKSATRGVESVAVSQSKVKGLERRVAKLREQLAAEPEMQRDVERVNPMATNISVELARKEAERAELLQRYSSDDRLVRDIEAQIVMLKERLHSATGAAVVGSERLTANPLRTELQRRLLQSQLNLDDLKARIEGLDDKLEKQYEAGTREAIDLRRKSIELSRLEQVVASAREAYILYDKKHEEARISEELDKSRFLNVNLVDGPTMPLHPMNQMSPFMIVAAFIAGTGLGVGSAVGIEFLGRNFKFEEQVEAYLDLPVFAVIPDMSEVAEIQQS